MANVYDIIIRPIITERSMAGTSDKKYVFEVAPTAGKIEIKNAVEELNKTLPSYKKVLKIKLRSTEFEKTTSKKIRRVGLQTEENMAPSESGSTGKTE